LNRRDIRNDAATRIVAAGTDAGSRVYKSRALPIQSEQLPLCTVYTPNERNNWGGDTEPTYLTTTTLVVDCVVFGRDDAATEDALDELVAQVEDALIGSFDWRKQFTRCGQYSIDVQPGQDGKLLFINARLSFDVDTLTTWIEPAVDDFAQAVIDVDLYPPDGVPEVVADLTIPTT